jgi:hypothetical protein
MIFSLSVTPAMMIAGGLTLLALLVVQILIGMRKIKLGRKTFTYHRYMAFGILAIAAIHGLLGFLLLTGTKLF